MAMSILLAVVGPAEFGTMDRIVKLGGETRRKTLAGATIAIDAMMGRGDVECLISAAGSCSASGEG
jgi:hypothetical protein